MDPMDKIRQYHGARIRTLLRTSRTSNSHHENGNGNGNGNNNGISSVNATGLFTVKTDLSPLEVPEIFLMVLEYIPSHTYPVLCCVSKRWYNLTKPQIWKSISLSGLSLPLIAPYFPSNIDSTKRIDINLFSTLDFKDLSWFPRYFVEDRAFPNLTMIRIHGIIEAPEMGRECSFLFELIRRCPNLKKIDLRMSQLFQSYPLDILHECPHLESLAFDVPYWTDPFASSSWKIVPLYSGGRYWPNLRHLHIRGHLNIYSCADELTANLLKSSFRLESLILEGYPWKQKLFGHLVAPGARSEDDGESREVAKEEPLESMVSSLKLRHYSNTDVDFDKMPKLTKLEILGNDTGTLGISTLLGESTCGRLVELTLFKSYQKDLCILLSHTRRLRKLSVRMFMENGPVYGAEAPRWKCLGLEELTLCWGNSRSGVRRSGQNRTSMAFWRQIGSLKQLSVLRLRHCEAICDDSITPCPLVMLKDLNQLRHLEVTHSSKWSLQEVTCVAEFWPRLSLLEYHLSKMSIFHWSWLRQMRPFLFMEDLEKNTVYDED